MIGIVSENIDAAKIIVVGVGGGGCNAVNRMIDSGAKSVEFIAINTDSQALDSNKANKKIKLITDEDNPKGLGAGGRPEVGATAAQRAKNEISQALEGADMVFITAGMGGGTGTGGAPIVASIAKEKKVLTVSVVTKPFRMEGSKRMKYALAGIDELKKYVDTLIVIPNQRLKDITTQKTSFEESLKLADEVLRQGVIGIADIISGEGNINIDFADICTVMSDKGLAHMGVGTAENAAEAAELAIKSPLLETSIEGAQSVLINFCGSESNLLLHAVEDAVDLISETIDPEAEVFFGFSTLEEMDNQITVTVIATGLPDSGAAKVEPVIRRKKADIETVKVEEVKPAAKSPEVVKPAIEEFSDFEEDDDDFKALMDEKTIELQRRINPVIYDPSYDQPERTRGTQKPKVDKSSKTLDISAWFKGSR